MLSTVLPALAQRVFIVPCCRLVGRHQHACKDSKQARSHQDPATESSTIGPAAALQRPKATASCCHIRPPWQPPTPPTYWRQRSPAWPQGPRHESAAHQQHTPSRRSRTHIIPHSKLCVPHSLASLPAAIRSSSSGSSSRAWLTPAWRVPHSTHQLARGLR